MALVRRCADNASKHLRFYSVASHIVASANYSKILVLKLKNCDVLKVECFLKLNGEEIEKKSDCS